MPRLDRDSCCQQEGWLQEEASELAEWGLGDALEAVGAEGLSQLVGALAAERRVVVVCEALSVRGALVLSALALLGPHWPHLALVRPQDS